MEIYRIGLKSNTAFFRNEVTSTSYQETFNCPPLSTIHGLIAAAYGEYRYDIEIGYVFKYLFKACDSELIMRKNSDHKDLYKKFINDNRFDRNDILRGCGGTIPVKREVLFDCTLYLYINNAEVAMSFNNPFYSLLLGRSEDIASVFERPHKISMQNVKESVNFGMTIVPFGKIKLIPGRISKMNIKISETYPRKVETSGIFNIIDKTWPISNLPDSVKFDPELNMGVYIHKG